MTGYVKVYNDFDNNIKVESKNVSLPTVNKCIEQFKKMVDYFETTDLILEFTFDSE